MSQVSQDVIIELREKCEKVQNLLEEESKRDPEDNPYKSKYAAREVLNDMKSRLSNIKDSIPSNDPSFELIENMYGAVMLLLGTISIDTEELATGEEQLMNCLNKLEDRALNPQSIVIVIKALNQLGLLWSQRGDPNKSHGYTLKTDIFC